MAKITWKPGTMLAPIPPALISCGTVEKPNVMTVAWTGIISSEPAMTYVSIRPSRYSHELISQSGEFVINLVNLPLVKAADWCGIKSGRDLDKFKEMNLTAVACSQISAPQIEESPVSIECKVKSVTNHGTHDMFLAEIVAVNVDDKYIDEEGKLWLEKSGLVAYVHGFYYTLGRNLGKFGFSVEKNPQKPKKKDFEVAEDTTEEISEVGEERRPREDRPRRDGYAPRPHRDGEFRPRRDGDAPRPHRDGEFRPRRDGDAPRPHRDGEFRPRRDGDAPRPHRDGEFRPRRDGDAPRPQRSGEFRPRRDGDAPRPHRDGEFRPRRDGDAPRPQRSGEFRPRRDGDAPRPHRDGEFRPRRDGDAPRPQRDGEFRPRRDGDAPRPQRSGEFRPRRDGDSARPQRSGEFRPRRDGDSARPQRSGEFRPRRDGDAPRERRDFDDKPRDNHDKDSRSSAPRKSYGKPRSNPKR